MKRNTRKNITYTAGTLIVMVVSLVIADSSDSFRVLLGITTLTAIVIVVVLLGVAFAVFFVLGIINHWINEGK